MNLKYIRPFLLPVLFVLVMAACGGDSQPTPDKDVSVEAKPADAIAKKDGGGVDTAVEKALTEATSYGPRGTLRGKPRRPPEVDNLHDRSAVGWRSLLRWSGCCARL